MINQHRKDNAHNIIEDHFASRKMGLLETIYIKNQDIQEVMDYFIVYKVNPTRLDITEWYRNE